MKMETQPIWFKRHCPCRMIFFSHSSSGSAIRISLDIQRQNVDASEATTPGIYSGFWVYYQYMDAGVLKTSGLGWYLRTTRRQLCGVG